MVKETKLVKIGSSKGVIIPSKVLKECGINDKVKFESHGKRITISPIESPRENWEKAFKSMNDNRDDELIIDDLTDIGETWEWQ